MKKLKINIANIVSEINSKHLEELIGKISGVSVVKINHATGKTVVIFDEFKTGQKNIYKTILEAGNYLISKNESEIKESENILVFDRNILLGLLISISTFSVIINIVLFYIAYK